MKILCLSTYYYPYRSGLSEYARRVNGYFVSRRHAVSALAIRHEPDLAGNELVDGVKVTRVPYLIRISKGFVSFFWIVALFRLIPDADVIMLHLPQPESIIPILVAKLFHKKIIIVYHCDVVLGNRIGQQIIQWLMDCCHRVSLRFADKIIVNSQDYARHSRLRDLFIKKTFFIPPPAKEYMIDGKIRKLFIKSHADLDNPEIFKIGFAGRIAREKGLEFLIAALPEIQKNIRPKKAVLFIAGPKQSVGEADYRRKIETLVGNNQKSVRMLGELADWQMGAFISLLDVLAVPSVNATEAYGMIQAEAMRLGVPVVASDLPGVRELVRITGYGKLTNPKDSGDLAEKIYKLAAEKIRFDPEKYQDFFDPQVSLEKIGKTIGI